MYVNRRDSNNSAVIGQRGEDIFEDTIKKYYDIEVVKANFNQQINEHWDFKLVGVNHELTVDVKAMKRKGRWDGEPQDEIIWIEFFAVNGKCGWVYSCSVDCFGFQCTDGFLFVGRRKLAEACEKLVGFKREHITLENSGSQKGLYKLYTRKGRKDILTTITKQDLLNIEHIFLKY